MGFNGAAAGYYGAGPALKAMAKAKPSGVMDRFDQAIDYEGRGGGWQGAYNQTAGSTLAQALPQLRQGLQLSRESAIRRGISTGDLQAGNEGDLTKGWGQNLANAFAGQAQSAYENNRNRYLDLVSGQLDRETAERNARKQQQSSNTGGFLNLAAAALPFFL